MKVITEHRPLRSRFAQYEEACRVVKKDKFHDRDWAFDESLRTKSRDSKVREERIATKANDLMDLLGL